MLHPTASDDAKALSKKERGRRLQRELVTQCLRTGELLHLVPTHARAFSDRVTLDSPGDYEVDANDQVDADEGLDKEKQRRQQIARRVQNVLRLMWPDARVLLFGSSVTGLWTPADKTKTEQADVDLCALLPSAPQFRQETAPLVTEVKEHLALYLLPDGTSEGEQGMTAVTRARIPIVHFQDPATELPCDLCVNNVPALWNTRLLHSLLRGDLNASCTERRRLHQARRLCQWLRQWRHSKKRVVGGALSSYGLTLLALYYLQRISVLPVLDCSSHVVENESSVGSLTEGDIDKQLERLKRIYVSDEDHAKGSAKNWQALRRGFFRFYTCDFDYENTVVSLRKTEVMPKTSKGWSRQNNTRLCLEDPVEIERDLGTLCSRLALGRLRCAFAHACIVLSENEEDLDTESTSTEHDLEADLLASWAFEEDCSREKDSHETEG
ncbi:unnamed protein product [Phytophthora lilii]|uniref:Unnamed protein product n=1 Tax=Phytophthora lilii TaxID=2077276 RepID=A0A9W7D7F7_9STRA|nr:unnamed protein product [Phytophthora lilii]